MNDRRNNRNDINLRSHLLLVVLVALALVACDDDGTAPDAGDIADADDTSAGDTADADSTDLGDLAAEGDFGGYVDVVEAPEYSATIRYTSYGIPHVVADDFGSLSFGVG